ncbi:MAG: pseudouridine synthase [Parcubacteria group bacterium]
MDEFPMRINKYVAHKGLATRKEADELIKAQQILINKKIAVLGDKVTELDQVEILGNHREKEYLYLAYNKPVGIITTNPQGEEMDILQSISEDGRITTKVFPVGRLDKDSHGLIILTNDGRITDRLLNPANEHEKEYVVTVSRSISPEFIRQMSSGVKIDTYTTRPALVKKLGDKTFSIVLTEGKNRQIRRMTEKLNYTVVDLKRVRVQNVLLSDVAENSYREIAGEEQRKFLGSLGL